MLCGAVRCVVTLGCVRYVRHVMLCIQNMNERFGCLGLGSWTFFFFWCVRMDSKQGRKQGKMNGWMDGWVGVRCFATLGWWVAR